MRDELCTVYSSSPPVKSIAVAGVLPLPESPAGAAARPVLSSLRRLALPASSGEAIEGARRSSDNPILRGETSGTLLQELGKPLHADGCSISASTGDNKRRKGWSGTLPLGVRGVFGRVTVRNVICLEVTAHDGRQSTRPHDRIRRSAR